MRAELTQVESTDVHEERVRVEGLASADGQAMVVRELRKVYPGQVSKPCPALSLHLMPCVGSSSALQGGCLRQTRRCQS